MKKSLATFALLSTVLSTFISTSAVAKDNKHISKTMDINEGQKISINVPVGSLKVDVCECDTIELSVTVESSSNSWNIFSSNGDVDDAELKIKQRSNSIAFEIDEENTKQKWQVTLPASSPLAFEIGVGEVRVNDLNNDLKADIGVGEANIHLSDNNFQQIELDSGVGDTSIRGFKGEVDSHRAVVSSSASYHGNGEHSISVDVGVGEVNVRR